jgi:light-regulated signal transduction histidine kinase (bacteriophytochrome)
MILSEKTPKQEAEELMNDLLPLAKRMLSEHGEFYPYGGYMDRIGKIVHVGAQLEGTNKPESRPLIEILRDDFRKLAALEKCKATAVIFDVRIMPPGAVEKSDAIQVCLDHLENYSAEVFFPYRISDGEVVYGAVFAQRGDGLIFSN